MAVDEAHLRAQGWSDADIAYAKRYEAVRQKQNAADAQRGPPSPPKAPPQKTPMQFLMEMLHGKTN